MEQKLKMLVVEDDPNLGSLLTEYLKAKGYEATLATDGEKGLKAFRQGDFEFLILDVMMPIKDGFTLAKEIREKDQKVPILFLTAKSMKEDTIQGFRAGGDDYMTKPFSMEELLLRVDAIMRRAGLGEDAEPEPEMYCIGQYEFDHKKQRLLLDEKEFKLTTKENELLKLLCKNQNGLLERNKALNQVWGDDNYFNGRSMDVYIAKLRKHLRGDPQVEILNVHGKGFKLLATEPVDR